MAMEQSVIISQTFAPLIPPTASGGPLPFTRPRAATGPALNTHLRTLPDPSAPTPFAPSLRNLFPNPP